MQFCFMVMDSDGDEDTATVTSKVQPALDPDRLLKYVGGDGDRRWLRRRGSLPRLAQPQLKVRARATNTTRSGDAGACRTVSEMSSAEYGSRTRCLQRTGRERTAESARAVYVPHLDVDVITRSFSLCCGLAPSLPDPASIDDADMELVLMLTPGAGAASTILYVFDRSGAVFAQNRLMQRCASDLELTAAEVEDCASQAAISRTRSPQPPTTMRSIRTMRRRRSTTGWSRIA